MLNKQLLNVKDLYVDVEDKEILHNVDYPSVHNRG